MTGHALWLCGAEVDVGGKDVVAGDSSHDDGEYDVGLVGVNGLRHEGERKRRTL